MKEILKNNLEHVQNSINRFDAPFFFYDLNYFENHLKTLRFEESDGIKMWYACKANPISSVLKILRNNNFGIDIASLGELHQVLNNGIPGKHLIATGPAKSKDYFLELIKQGLRTFVLESVNQLKWLNECAIERNVEVKGLLRIQIEWESGESVLGGNSITPFGLDPDEWIKGEINQYKHVQIIGAHCFQWGNILKNQELVSIWKDSINQAKSLFEELKIPLKIMDLGGGLGIPYHGTSGEIDFQSLKGELINLRNKHNLKEIWLELGRYAIGPSGFYCTKIIDIKTVRGKKLIVTDGGINHIARPALTKQYFECEVVNEMQSNQKYNFQVHGPLCTSLDYLGSFDFPSTTKIGDWLCFFNTGAYGHTEAMPYFLAHPLAGEVILYRDDLMMPRVPKNSFEWMI
ncbi:hypothetical protein N9N67_07310 [Bacteriovoracaceae bacterium]|nr:hypothetical protein [Bacteriovoracaceae bacterium]